MKIFVLSGQNDAANARHARALGAWEFVAKPCDPATAEARRSTARRWQPRPRPGRRGADRREPADRQAAQPDRAVRRLAVPGADRGRVGQRQGAGRARACTGSRRARAALISRSTARRSRRRWSSRRCSATPRARSPARAAHKSGYFEDAQDGTLFLDEIGELPLELQAKLLRVLENGEFQRVGETQRRSLAARASSPRPTATCASEVRQGAFRADLYHRLSVLHAAACRRCASWTATSSLLLEHFRALLRRAVRRAALRARRRGRGALAALRLSRATCASCATS